MVTHTAVSPLSSSALGNLHWLRAEKKPWASGRGAARAAGTATGHSSPPSQNQRKVMTSGWKWEASTIIVTIPGERYSMSLCYLKKVLCVFACVCMCVRLIPVSSFGSESWISETSGGASQHELFYY